MATEECKECGIVTTPWRYIKSLHGSICFNCTGEWIQKEINMPKIIEQRERKRNWRGKYIKNNDKD